MERIRQCVLQLSKALADAKWSPRPRILFELAIITMSEGEVEEAVPVRRAAPAVGQTAAAKPAEAPKPVVQTPAPAPKPAAPAPVQKAPEPEEDPFFAMNSSEAPPSEFFDIAPPADYVDEPVSMPPQEAESPRPSKPAAEPISASENDELWLRVLEDSRISPMIRMSGSILRGMSAKEFTVQVRNAVFEDQIKKNAALLEEIMEFETGKKLKLVTIVKD